MRNDLRPLIASLEQQVRAGHSQQLRDNFRRLNYRTIPRQHRRPLANIARRAGFYLTGLKIIGPAVIHRAQGVAADAKYGEIAEYAVLLQKIGRAEDALQLMNRINAEELPIIHLYRTFCYASQWQYEKSIEPLKLLLGQPKIEAYQANICMVNLLASYVFLEQFEAGLQLSEKLQAHCRQQGHDRLLANTLELTAQIYIARQEFARAEKMLATASTIFSQDSSVENLFVLKWRSYIADLKAKKIHQLRHFRQQAVKKRHWESVREADFLCLRISFDRDLFNRLYFGTPFMSYRAKILNVFNSQLVAASVAKLGPAGQPELDLQLGTYAHQDLGFLGSSTHRLLAILNQDLYRSMHYGYLHSQMFPNEYFNPFSSPNRVQKIVSRARAAVAAERLPIRIDESHGQYRLEYGRQTKLVLHDLPVPPNKSQQQLLRFCQQWSEEKFSMRQYMNLLKLPLASANRSLKAALAQGDIEKLGSGPQTRYRVSHDFKRRFSMTTIAVKRGA